MTNKLSKQIRLINKCTNCDYFINALTHILTTIS